MSGESLVVNIPELSIERVEAVLEENAAGELGLQRAFESRTPEAGEPSSATDVTIGAIQIKHVWAHGHLASAPVLDADLKDFAGGFTSTPKSTGIDVQHVRVIGRGFPGMNPEGRVVARASLPTDPKGETQIKASYDGRIGDIPVRADGSLTGKVVVATIDVPETAPTAFAALAPGQIHLGAPLRAHAEVHGELPILEPELRAYLGAGEITASGTVTLPDEARVDLSATAQLHVKDLDLSLLETSAPPSRLTTLIEAAIQSGVQLASARLTASTDGPLEAPRFKANVRGSGLRAGGYAFTSVNASASGTPSEIDVTIRLVGDESAPSVATRAHVSAGKALTVRNVGATIERGEVTSTATIDAIHVVGAAIDIRGAKVEGLGDPILASARISPAVRGARDDEGRRAPRLGAPRSEGRLRRDQRQGRDEMGRRDRPRDRSRAARRRRHPRQELPRQRGDAVRARHDHRARRPPRRGREIPHPSRRQGQHDERRADDPRRHLRDAADRRAVPRPPGARGDEALGDDPPREFLGRGADGQGHRVGRGGPQRARAPERDREGTHHSGAGAPARVRRRGDREGVRHDHHASADGQGRQAARRRRRHPLVPPGAAAEHGPFGAAARARGDRSDRAPFPMARSAPRRRRGSRARPASRPWASRAASSRRG